MATDSRINLANVEAELKGFIERLPRCKHAIKDPLKLTAILDKAIALGKGALKQKDIRPLTLEEELLDAAIEGYLAEVWNEQNDMRLKTPTHEGYEEETVAPPQECGDIGRGILQMSERESFPLTVPGPSLPVPSPMKTSDEIPLPLSVESSTSSANTTNETKGIAAKTRHDHQWNAKFEELQTYKEVHGHCNVPMRYKPNKSLGKWVHHQRDKYRQEERGTKSSLTKDRIVALESIGFRWRVAAPRFDPPRMPWGCRLEELKQYKEKHGDCT